MTTRLVVLISIIAALSIPKLGLRPDIAAKH